MKWAKNTFQKYPFLLRTLKAVKKKKEKDDKEGTKMNIVNLTSCLNLGRSGHEWSYTAKISLISDSWPVSASEFPLPCLHTDYTLAVAKLNFLGPHFPFIWIWKSCDSNQSLCFHSFWLQSFSAKAERRFFLPGFPFALLQGLLHTKGSEDFMYAFTSQVFHSQPSKDDK